MNAPLETKDSSPQRRPEAEGVPLYFLVLIALPLTLAPAAFLLGRGWLWGSALGGMFTLIAAATVFWGSGRQPLRAGIALSLPVVGLVALLLIPGSLREFTWEPYTAPDQSFKVDLPGKPVHSPTLESGVEVPGQKVVSESGGTLFQILFVDLTEVPEAPDQFIAQAEERIVSRGGKVVKKEELPTRAGGREVHLEGTAYGNSLFQIFLVENRFYQLEVTGHVEPSAVARFFKSFTLR